LPSEQTADLSELADRSLSLQCNIQDGEVWMIRGATTVHVTPLAIMGR
jgi:uncharacterized protein YaeQ